MKPLLLILFLAVTAVAQTYPAEANGAAPGASATTNTSAIQTTLDSASAGGLVTITTPGVYLLAAQGVNPYWAGDKYVLDFKYDNVHFHLGAGVTLKLANGQQTDAGGPVDLLVFRSRSGLTFSGASDGSSTITGNAAGQTGWTGGYAQIVNGIIISGYGSLATGGNNGITVTHLNLKDHFSNPININTNVSSVTSNNISISYIHSSDCGEGIQVISANDVTIDHCIVDSPNHVAVGDAIEVSAVDGFAVTNNIVKNHWFGSGVDVFVSMNGVVENTISDDNVDGVGIESFDVTFVPKNITVNNVIVTNPRNSTGTGVCDGLAIGANAFENVKIKNLRMNGTAFSYGIQLGAFTGIKTTGGITIEDCVVDGGVAGIAVNAAYSDLTIKGGSYTNMTEDGITYPLQANGLLAADVKNLHIEGVTATGNGRYGIFINNQGFAVPQMTGSITNCFLGQNGVAPITAGDEGSGLTVSVTPDSKTAFGGGLGAAVFGIKHLCPTGANVTSFQYPSKDQKLEITACEERDIIDARDGGLNIFLAGGRSVHLRIGDRLLLGFDNVTEAWHEEGRWLTPGPPQLSVDQSTGQAVALNATTFVLAPFISLTEPNFSEDQRTRVMLFVEDFDLTAAGASSLTAQAEDSLLRTYPLTIEHVGPTNVNSLSVIIVLLPEELYALGEVRVSINLNGVAGNRAKLTLSAAR